MKAGNPIETYSEALGAHLEGDRAIVLDGLIRQGLHYDGRPICTVLRPFLIDAREKVRRDRAAALVAKGVRIAARAAAGDPALRRLLLLTEAEEEAVRMEDGYTGELFARLDGLVDASGALRFLEYNPFPSGFAYADKIAERFEVTAAFRACAARFELEGQRLIPQFVRSLLAYIASSPAEQPCTVGIVAPTAGQDSVDAVPEMMFVLEALGRAGIAVHVSDASGVSLRDDRLVVGDGQVDAVFVTDWAPLISAEARRAAPLWAAWRAGRVVLLDSPSSSALHGAKAIFALLSDPAHDALFPSEVAAALRRHVPWTRPMVEGTTTRQGDAVDLVRALRAQREQFVLKPAHAYGGAGVVLGWESTESEWDAAIAKALSTPYVAQERAFGDTALYPVAIGHSVEQRALLFDWNPFVWHDGSIHGVIARLGVQSILNVKAGASLVPIFAASDRAAWGANAENRWASEPA